MRPVVINVNSAEDGSGIGWYSTVNFGRWAASKFERLSNWIAVWLRVSSPRTIQPKLLAGLLIQSCTSLTSPGLLQE